jgi:hypothetical protein
MAGIPTRREPVPGKEVGAQPFKLLKSEIRAHGFLNGHYVNPFVSHVLDELAAAVILAETADVPEESLHQGAIHTNMVPQRGINWKIKINHPIKCKDYN